MEDGRSLGYSQCGNARGQAYESLVRNLVAEVFDFEAAAADCAAFLAPSRQL